MNTRKIAFPLLLNLHIEIMKKGRLARAGDYGQKDYIFMIHNLQNSFICMQEELRGFSLNFLTLKHLLLSWA